MTSDRSESPAALPETVRHWNARLQEWTVITVTATPPPRRTPRATLASVRPVPEFAPWPEASSEAPIPPMWRATAYAETGPLADLRTYVKPASMRTHRAPAVLPVADMGHVTETGR